MSEEKTLKNRIDDYKDTIYAILGFMNFYRYDDKANKDRENVCVFQGRKLTYSTKDATGKEIEGYVTPDIGILMPDGKGIVGEVKNSFPANHALWQKEFEQVKSYDKDLGNWPNPAGKVASHDIALLVHISRSADVRDFYTENKDTTIQIQRPFCIVHYTRSDQSKSNVWFRKEIGKLSSDDIDQKLHSGVQVPMIVFVDKYSTIKLIDCEPPLPYLLELIYANVLIQKAKDDPRFPKMRKNQKIIVPLKIDEIIDTLHRGFSFHCLNEGNGGNQSKTPKREWIIRACDKLVSKGEAEWGGEGRSQIIMTFKPLDDVLDHYTKLCSDEEDETDETQISLFEN